MTLHAFCPGDSGAHRTYVSVGFPVHPLPGHRLDKLADAQAAAVTCGPLGGEDMVRPGCLVSVGDSGFLTQEERSIVGKVGEPPVKISGVDFQVLRSIVVTLLNRFFARFGNDNLPVIPPGRFRPRCG